MSFVAWQSIPLKKRNWMLYLNCVLTCIRCLLFAVPWSVIVVFSGHAHLVCFKNVVGRLCLNVELRTWNSVSIIKPPVIYFY